MEQKPETQPPRNAQETSLAGTIERFTFRNPETGYAVVRFRPHRGGPVTAVGTLAQLAEGQEVEITGTEVEHPRYGPQIEVRVAEAVLPSTVAGIRTYLASSLVKGIGPATAERITDTFGEDTLRVIEEEPERLRAVPGLGQKRIDELVQAVHAQKDIQKVMVFLRAHGLGPGLATRIVKRYGAGASALIQANPYRLADEVIGLGFRTADRLAGSMGIAPGAPERLQAGMLFELAQASRRGHCFQPEDELVRSTAELLTVGEEAVRQALPELAATGQVRREPPPGPPALRETHHQLVYPRQLHLAETGCARALHRLLTAPGAPLPVRPEDAVRWFEQRSGMVLPEEQRRAIRASLTAPVSVITGGPGVGKTTIVRGLAEILGAKGLELRLAAPTGRAAKRLEESTRRSATTLHRLLEYQAGVGRFLRDDRNPLEGDMLVVDETSMLDVRLAHDLLRAVPPTLKVVLVGDVDQLPAVGPGNVLADVIASGRVPVTALTTIFRQQQDSWIVRSAHALLRGEVPESGPEGSDFYFVDARDGGHARGLVRELVTRRIPDAFGLDPMADVQVLCPMYRGEVGADTLNQELQQALNPGDDEIGRGGRTFRRGDKVMQVRNDHDLEIYNGDLGRITAIERGASTLRVAFGTREIEYRFEDLDQLVPAYAISVHRSQGSEYPAVIVPVTTEHFVMLRRNLLYTAITRGRRLVVLVGSRKALEMAARNHGEASRHSALAERLRAPLRGDGVHPERLVGGDPETPG